MSRRNGNSDTPNDGPGNVEVDEPGGDVVDVTPPQPSDIDMLCHWILRVIKKHLAKTGGGFTLTTKTRGVDPLGEQISAYPIDLEADDGDSPIENLANEIIGDVERDAKMHGGGVYYIYAWIEKNTQHVARFPMRWGANGPITTDAEPTTGSVASLDTLASAMHDAVGKSSGSAGPLTVESLSRALENQQRLWLAGHGGLLEGFLKQQDMATRRQRQDDQVRVERDNLNRRMSDRNLELELARDERREREEKNRQLAGKCLFIAGKFVEYQIARRNADTAQLQQQQQQLDTRGKDDPT